MISKKAIKTFMEIYKKEFDEEIDEAMAREQAGRLLELVKIIYQNHEPRGKNN